MIEKAVVRKDDFRMEKFPTRWRAFFPELQLHSLSYLLDIFTGIFGSISSKEEQLEVNASFLSNLFLFRC